jgi:hypothetical protein
MEGVVADLQKKIEDAAPAGNGDAAAVRKKLLRRLSPRNRSGIPPPGVAASL